MNVEFSPSVCEGFINNLYSEACFKYLREMAVKLGVPSLEAPACCAVTNIVSIKRPLKSIDIGCGIGVSSLAILNGFPLTNLTAIDGNLERLSVFNEYFKDSKNVKSIQIRGEAWLKGTDEKYDFAFVDSVKRDYPTIWENLKPRLNKNAVVVFDDILIYGYVLCEDAEIPKKYLENAQIMREFLSFIFNDESLSSQIIPVSGGLLSISLK